MVTKAELIKTAAFLYQLGTELEEARQNLKDLVEAGVSYESNEMRSALEKFQLLYFRWKQTDQEYLALRQKVLNHKE